MRKLTANSLVLALCLVLVAACCDCAPAPTRARHNYGHTKSGAAIVNPEVESPKSHKTCVDDFHFTPGTPQYDKCVSSLGEIEVKD